MPPAISARFVPRRFAGAAASGRMAPGMSGASTARPQWIQNFHAGASGDPQPTQVSIAFDCMGVIFWL
jgi:hypothetical protein